MLTSSVRVYPSRLSVGIISQTPRWDKCTTICCEQRQAHQASATFVSRGSLLSPHVSIKSLEIMHWQTLTFSHPSPLLSSFPPRDHAFTPHLSARSFSPIHLALAPPIDSLRPAPSSAFASLRPFSCFRSCLLVLLASHQSFFFIDTLTHFGHIANLFFLAFSSFF